MAATATDFTPESYPPFPHDLPTVELETISLAQLQAGNTNEQDKLFEICVQQGFFYLDFTDTSAALLPSDSKTIVSLAEDVFKLPIEEKQNYCPDQVKNLLFGYKPQGSGATDKKGTKDTSEFFNISKDDMMLPTPTLPWPEPVLTKRVFLSNYMKTAHSTGLFVLSQLAIKLGLPADAFDHLHHFDQQSGDHVRMTRGPPRKNKSLPEIQTAGHTDFGTITILFNWLGGLQIWSEPNRGANGFANIVDPESNGQAKWLWVKPKPGHAIVNLGDAAVKFTNGLFCSGRHRVVPAPGEQGLYPRHSVVYFVRPVDEALLKPIECEAVGKAEVIEEDVTMHDWISGQMKVLRGEVTPAGC